MTFLEAAIEILRNEPNALHFSEIAKAAVARKLLSHVGRDPEAAMRSCLTSAVRGGQGDILSRTKPGHYTIRPGAVLPDPPPEPVGVPTPKPRRSAPAADKKKASDVKATAGRSKATGRSSRKAASAKAPAAKVVAADADEAVEAASGDAATSSGDPPQSTQVEPDAPAADAEDAATGGSTAKRGGRRRGRGRRRERDDTADAEKAAKPLVAEGEDPESAAGEGAVATPAASTETLTDQVNLEFSAPAGAGLDGVTDVAVVMANAMSRLADERPELREELEAMQARNEAEASVQAELVTARGGERERFAANGSRPGAGGRAAKPARQERERDDADDRLSRRRRRRRRRSRKPDWSARTGSGTTGVRVDDLLDRVAKVLGEAGSRSLHVRQISESLAEQKVLGGEISEIERAVTSAILADVSRFARRSRFVARGDARYQLQGSRLPKGAAEAEEALRGKALALEDETKLQLVNWLGSLGVRALESVVRIFLQRRDYAVAASLPPTRGLAKLIIEDSEDDEVTKSLVVVAPRKSSFELSSWQAEAEEHGCAQLLVFAMGEAPEETDGDSGGSGNVRIRGADDLGRWLFDNGVGVERVVFDVPVLDPVVIESIGGLDT